METKCDSVELVIGVVKGNCVIFVISSVTVISLFFVSSDKITLLSDTFSEDIYLYKITLHCQFFTESLFHYLLHTFFAILLNLRVRNY